MSLCFSFAPVYMFLVHALDTVKNVSKVVNNFGCCYNNFVLPFEETDGIDAK